MNTDVTAEIRELGMTELDHVSGGSFGGWLAKFFVSASRPQLSDVSLGKLADSESPGLF